MLIFPKKISKYKCLSICDNGYKILENMVVIGERAILYNKKTNHLIYTKGAEYQLDSTLPKCVFTFPRRTIESGRCLCFPGMNYRIWYHIVTDLGFQMFLVKKLHIAESIVVPSSVKNYQPVLDFLNLFGLNLIFVNSPRKALKLKSAVVFDKFTGRLSEAISGSKLDREIRDYFLYLTKKSRIFNSREHGNKIFSTRKGSDSRVYDKFSEIEKKYISQGYNVVYFGEMSLDEQMKIMSNITHFAGFHGSNLSNMVFAPNLRYVEELVTGRHTNDFKKIARFRNIHYSNRIISTGNIRQVNKESSL